jgi:hypothetical protein
MGVIFFFLIPSLLPLELRARRLRAVEIGCDPPKTPGHRRLRTARTVQLKIVLPHADGVADAQVG